MSVLRRRDSSPAVPGSGADLCASEFAKRWPGLHEFLTAMSYPDGGARVPGTVTFFVDGGLYKACLNDRDAGLTAWVSGPCPVSCWEAIEAGLQQDGLEWRRPTSIGKKKR